MSREHDSQAAAWAAGVILVLHGATYVGFAATASERSAEVLWYVLLWGPWFMVDGALFIAAARTRATAAMNRRTTKMASMVGAALGLVVAILPYAVGVLASVLGTDAS